MKIFRKRFYCYLLAYTCKGGEGCMTVNLERKIKTSGDLKELQKYIEKNLDSIVNLIIIAVENNTLDKVFIIQKFVEN